MSDDSKALQILLHEAEELGGSTPEQLVRDIYAVEEHVQFDQDRREATGRVQRLVRTAVDQEDLQTTEGDADAPE